MLHLDIWGPYQTKTPSGCNLFLTIVDDYNRFTWVQLLKNKSDVVQVLQNFIAYIDIRFNSKIKTIRSDNAKEFCEGNFPVLCKAHGIIQQRSCIYTPEQNGVVERKHRHLLETARALSFQSKLPATYWGECILSATYIINRMPLKSIDNHTPYFRL